MLGSFHILTSILFFYFIERGSSTQSLFNFRAFTVKAHKRKYKDCVIMALAQVKITKVSLKSVKS